MRSKLKLMMSSIALLITVVAFQNCSSTTNSGVDGDSDNTSLSSEADISGTTTVIPQIPPPTDDGSWDVACNDYIGAGGTVWEHNVKYNATSETFEIYSSSHTENSTPHDIDKTLNVSLGTLESAATTNAGCAFYHLSRFEHLNSDGGNNIYIGVCLVNDSVVINHKALRDNGTYTGTQDHCSLGLTIN